MPFIHVTWLPKACRTASTRKEVADAIIKAVTAVKSADIAPENLVVRFSESVGGFPLPKGYSEKYVRGMTASLPGHRPRHIVSHYLRPSTLAMQPRPFGAGQGTMRPQARMDGECCQHWRRVYMVARRTEGNPRRGWDCISISELWPIAAPAWGKPCQARSGRCDLAGIGLRMPGPIKATTTLR